MSDSHPPTNYVRVWIVLSVAFGISLVATAVSGSQWAIAFVFLIALFKAWLVASRFMHVTLEQRAIKVLIVGCLLALMVLYVGLIPDIAWVFGAEPVQ